MCVCVCGREGEEWSQNGDCAGQKQARRLSPIGNFSKVSRGLKK